MWLAGGGGEEKWIQFLVGKPERKKPLRRPRRRREYMILSKVYGWAWTVCIWLRVGASDGLF
jgi:hypothetical protein